MCLSKVFESSQFNFLGKKGKSFPLYHARRKVCLFVFSFDPDIRYMMGIEQVREIPLTVDEIKLIKSVKCELFQ